jgi:hypothetical protein
MSLVENITEDLQKYATREFKEFTEAFAICEQNRKTGIRNELAKSGLRTLMNL